MTDSAFAGMTHWLKIYHYQIGKFLILSKDSYGMTDSAFAGMTHRLKIYHYRIG